MGAASDKSGDAPDCGLYIRINDDFVFEETVRKLQQLFFVPKKSAYKKNMHIVEFPGAADDSSRAEEIKGMIGFARHSGFVALIRGHAGHAGEWRADGVMLESSGDIPAIRAALGEEAIIGVECGVHRARAEDALAAGADCVAFSLPDGGGRALPPVDLVSWWATRSEIPSIVKGRMTNDDCGPFVQAGATFIDATTYIMDHPQGVMQAVSNMLYAIDLAAVKTAVN